jgi:hypothetical protein
MLAIPTKTRVVLSSLIFLFSGQHILKNVLRGSTIYSNGKKKKKKALISQPENRNEMTCKHTLMEGLICVPYDLKKK